ncbi:MAG: hypothetical protein AAF456_14240 [Planctomycetota bacterium]
MISAALYKTNLAIAVAFAIVHACLMPTSAQATPMQEQQAQSADESTAILTEQSALAEDYRLLEEKLFKLYEFERESNPARSDLLKRAFLQSQETMTTRQLSEVVAMIESGNLRDAETMQADVLAQMQALLVLLESEDRGKRVRDDIRRHQEYLKEVERILRIQRGLRGQAEAGSDPSALEQTQNNTANRTGQLGDEIERSEQPDESQPDPGGQPEPDPDENENPDGGLSPESEPSDGELENNGSDSEPPGQESSENQSGRQSNGQPAADEGTPAEGGESAPMDQQQSNPVINRIRQAEQRMREASEDLKRAQMEQSIEDMQAAETEMAAARQELEEILRQLREEEIERTLAMLESRFRQILEREIKVYEGTKTLAETSERGTAFEITAGRLAAEQNEIAIEAARALMLLDEDGSSVAFPETVDQMREDMIQVAGRLSAARAGQTTLEIEEDIIETLNYIITALVTTQEDLERMNQAGNQQSSGSSAGEQPLVDQLAEIKMLRGLQERIYRRHVRYSRRLPDPEDPLGEANDAELQRALTRLAQRQEQLTEIARDIVAGLNK